jgi:hypothetical protein
LQQFTGLLKHYFDSLLSDGGERTTGWIENLSLNIVEFSGHLVVVFDLAKFFEHLLGQIKFLFFDSHANTSGGDLPRGDHVHDFAL